MADRTVSVALSAEISSLVTGFTAASAAAKALAADIKAAGAATDSMGRQTAALSKVSAAASSAGAATSAAGAQAKSASEGAAAAAEKQAAATTKAGIAASAAASAAAAGATKTAAAASSAASAVEGQTSAWGRVRGAVSSAASAVSAAAATQETAWGKIRAVSALAGNAVSEYASGVTSKMSATLSSIEKNSEAWGRVGNSMLLVGGLAAASLGLTAKAAMDWQQQFTGVTKTVDGTAAQFKVLEGQLLGMARTMPASTQEIAGVAEAAGQLGVKTEDVARFTKTMVQMGVATNLSSEEAATGIAQFMNIMGTSAKDVDRVAASIVKLGNNGASTEKQILDMGQRLAGAGNQVRMTESQVLAFANALASVGINAEAGGTAMSKVFLKLDGITRSGGDRLARLNQIAGVDFKKAFAEDAAGATNKLVEGLGKMQAEGGDAAGALEDLGIKGSYERDAMMRLAGATIQAGAAQSVLANSLRDGAQGWAENSALMNEYAKFADTSLSKAKVAWNNIKVTMIDAGRSALPVIEQLAAGVSGLAKWFGSLPPEALKTGAAITGIVAVLALLGGGAVKAMVGLAELQTALKAIGAAKAASAITDLVSSAAALPGAFKSGALSVGGFKRELIGLGAAAAGFIALQVASNAMSKEFREATASAKEYENALASMAGTGTIRELDASFAKMGQTVAMWGRGIKDTDTAFVALKESSGAAGRAFKTLGDALNMDSSLGLLRDEFDKLDKSLSSMEPQKAAVAFGQVSASATKAGISMQDQLSIFDEYGNKLQAVAVETTGAQVSQQELYEWMGGRVPEAVRKAVAASPEAAKSFEKVGGAAVRTAKDIEGAANEMLALSGSQVGVESAIASASEALKENGRNLDLTTEKGRANRTALNDLASAGMRYVENLAKQGKSVEEQDAALQRARDNYIRLAMGMGESRAEAEKMADAAFGAIPGLERTADAAGKAGGAAQGAGAKLRKLGDDLRGVPDFKAITIEADGIQPTTKSLAEIGGTLQALPLNKVLTITLPGGEKVTGTVQELLVKLQDVPKSKTVPVEAPGAAEAARKIAEVRDALMKTPESKNIQMQAPNAPVVSGDIGKIWFELQKIPDDTVIKVTLPNGQNVEQTAGQIKESIRQIPDDKPVTITASTNAGEVAPKAQADMNQVQGVERPINITTNAPQTAGIATGAMSTVVSAAANMWQSIQTTSSTKGAEVEGQTSGWRERFVGIFNDLRGRSLISWTGLWNDASGTGSARRGEIEGSTGGWRNRIADMFGDLRNRASGTWSSMWGGMRSTTDSMMGAIRSAVESAMRSIASAFSTGVDAAGRAWAGLRSKAADPVRFVINTVYNDGIRSMFNKVAGLFGMSGLPAASANFARGGIMPGYTPGRDIYEFYDPKHNIRLGLSGGEPIMRPEVGKLLGASGVETINEAARRGGQRGAAKALAGIAGHLQYANGGVFPTKPKEYGYAAGGVVSFNGVPMDAASAALLFAAQKIAGVIFAATQGSFRPATSYSGTTHTGAGAIDIANPSMGQLIALRSVGAAAWDRTGKGNWIPHIHAIFPVPGISGSAAGQYADYLRGGDGFGGADNGPRGLAGKVSSELIKLIQSMGDAATTLFMNPKQGITDLLQGALSKLSSIEGTQWGKAIAGIPRKMVADIADAAAKKMPGLAGGGYTGSIGRSRADDIPARLSAREFVQPETSVRYYGVDVMEALRQQRIPRDVLSQYAFANGGMPNYRPVSQPRGAGPSVTYAPVLVNADETRQWEDFMWRFANDVRFEAVG